MAGATGDLGRRIVTALLARGAEVTALVRHRSSTSNTLVGERVNVVQVDFEREIELAGACEGAACVVSAMSGLREVIIDAQKALVRAAATARCPRFIPSDFASDYLKQPVGWNRNFDLRREFHDWLATEPIAATSILNGMFTDLLTGPAPFVLFPISRVLYWEDADQPLDFTTMDDTAAFTADAALDPSTPRYLRIAGEVLTARSLAEVASEVTGKRFKTLRGGSLHTLERLIGFVKTLSPSPGKVFPPWQGMQYTHDMFAGCAKLHPLDNDRYPELRWTPVRQVLAARG